MPEKTISPHLFVIFGATGDLTKRKLLPAIYQLSQEVHLNDNCIILGVSTQSALDDDGFRTMARESLTGAGFTPGDLATWCDDRLYYYPVTNNAATDFLSLAERIKAIESLRNLPGNRVFYLATPPSVFTGTIAALGEAGLNQSPGWTRLVVEKPVGRDLTSAVQLHERIRK
jgi:glucose-6-phosphate 1-dehydrogenase